MNYFFLLLFSMTCLKGFSQTSDLRKANQSFIEIGISDGFYKIKEIDSSRYKSSGKQLSVGFLLTSLYGKHLKMSVGFYYTFDKYNLKQSLADSSYSFELNRQKKMSYLDMIWLGSFKFWTKKRFNLYGTAGFNVGLLAIGDNEYIGLNAEGKFNQFNDITAGALVGGGLTIHVNSRVSLDTKVTWKKFIEPVDLTDRSKPSFVNLTLAIVYGWRTSW